MRHVPHLFVPQPWQGESLTLNDRTEHHLRRVLRLNDGAALSYTDGQGRTGEGVLGDGGLVRGDESYLAPPVAKLTVAVAPPRSIDRVRFLVEKLGELGVDRLTWMLTERTNGRPPRAEKARAWAQEALEQSRGAWVMHVDDEMVRIRDLEGTILIADPSGAPAAPIETDTTLVVGPEGGLTSEERIGTPVHLGERVLRVETAAIVGAALLRRNTTERGDNRRFSG
jgi:16S rRNA (uracil1498-N3)-methyltransferase